MRLQVRALTFDDLPGCEALCTAIRWPWEPQKWRLLLSRGEGYGVEAPDGSLAGTVVLNRFGAAAASVGLMGVAPAWSRRGLGRALMERALERAGGVPVFLYATAQGERLYAQLGFRLSGHVHRFIGERQPHPVAPVLGGRRLRPMVAADLGPVAHLDEVAFGAPRATYLDALFAMADEARVVEDGQRLVGYGLGWSVGGRRILGPLVAEDSEVALALAEGLSEAYSGPLRMDVPSQCAELVGWATARGLHADAPAPLMVLHASCPPGRREWLWALAMPGLG